MGKEKKEIGKLLELLNEYSKNIGYFNEEDLQGQTKAWILSKEFGWIGWLVENDKIDFSLIPNKIKEIGIPMKINGEIKYGFDSSDYYWLLMLLSISNSPIEDLLLYLK